MLLRRLMEHIRTQDWLAVALDFVIVVVGVFIGIQLGNWNADRMTRNELSASLQGVAQDFSNTVWHRTDQIEWIDERMAGMELMLAALDGRELTPEELREAYSAMTVIAAPPPDPGRYAALGELQSNGLLNGIESPSLRSALSEVLSSRMLIDQFYEMSLRRLTAPDFSADSTIYDLVPSSDGQSPGTLEVISVDIEAARADPLFRRRIVQGHAVFSTTRQTLMSFRDVDCEVLRMLKAEGFAPSGHWLIENFTENNPAVQEGRDEFTCEAAP